MTFAEAVAIVKNEFKTYGTSPFSEGIFIEKTLDGFNCYPVFLYDVDGEILVTDVGSTCEVFDSVTEEEWTKLCKENGFTFQDWKIIKKFESIWSVYEFIKFMDLIADTLCPKE
ncbi:MAG: hypothetical protein IKZ28_01455 [Clostridia bacterium]|nr:hypothetical protein [Clostridia bacterium]